ncbi:MAG: ribosomal L7Ae/L30e/S12e/Gadd45 family protein [Tissierellaceae bacterium]|jgi:large subunit ribosomal protein L7A|nr:50S ribosomal protein L7ae-like protein [Tissierellia bacterium]
MTVDLKKSNRIVGAKQVKRALKASKVNKVYVARDADKRVTSEIVEQCKEMHIPLIYVETMKELGNACGIDINAAVAALLI